MHDLNKGSGVAVVTPIWNLDQEYFIDFKSHNLSHNLLSVQLYSEKFNLLLVKVDRSNVGSGACCSIMMFKSR